MHNNRLALTVVLFVAFVATVYGANYAVEHYGGDDGLVGVLWFLAPAGVYFAGLSFGLRDALHEVAGKAWRWWVFSAIALGCLLAYHLGDAFQIPTGHVSLALASAIAFGLSESADLLIYAPLRERHWPRAVVASNIVGALVDSAVFLWLAFGSLNFFWGQVGGKTLMVLPAILLVWLVRRHRAPAYG